MGSDAKSALTNNFVDGEPELGTILSTAAVIGDEFEIRILGAATGINSEQLHAQLSEYVQAGMVQGIDDDRYRFVDARVRRSIYDGLEHGQRSLLHRKIGDEIEKQYGTKAETHFETLAQHFSQSITSETRDKAVKYSIRAGQKAFGRGNFGAAGDYWRAALKMLPSSGGRADLRARALLNLNHELVSTGPEAVAYLEQALIPLESLNDRSWLGHAHSRLGYYLSAPHTGAEFNLSRAMAHFDKAEFLLQSPADRGKLAELCQYRCSACSLSMETASGLESGQRGLELCEQLEDWSRWAQLATAITHLLLASGQLSKAFALEQKAFERAQDFEDAYTGSTVAWCGAALYADVMDFGGALERHLRELARPRTSHSPFRSRTLQSEAAHMCINMGELEQARRMLRQLRGPDASTVLPKEEGKWDLCVSDLTEKLNLARTTGHVLALSSCTHWLGIVLRCAGRPEEAERFQLESLNISRSAPNLARQLWSAQELCLIYFDLGRREDASRVLAEARAILARGEDWRGLEGVIMRGQAVVSAMHRRYLDADAEFEKAINIHRRYRNRWVEAAAFHYWGRALIAAGDKPRACEKLDQATAIYRKMGAGQAYIDRVNEARAKAGTPVAGPIELASSSPISCSLVREGAIWSISHRNRTFRIKDMKGLRYIAHLLAHPGEEFHVLDLITVVESIPQPDSRESNEDLRVTSNLGDAGEILDARSKAEYRRRRDELRDQLDEAESANDHERALPIRTEMEMLEEQLASAVGLGGRDRKAADHAERARDRIRKSIHSSLTIIRENDPSLGHHLSTCIRTGYLCSYAPDPSAR